MLSQINVCRGRRALASRLSRMYKVTDTVQTNHYPMEKKEEMYLHNVINNCTRDK